MNQFVMFSSPYTGERKQVKVGFSWTLLLFASFWGIPLFLRKLHQWGILMLAVSMVSLLTGGRIFLDDGLPLAVAIIVLHIYLGFEGNELTAKNYSKLGWKMSGDTDAVKFAKQRWGII
tara:strand:+ start:194 stop:550 length:357 start_codon:yes stop_codon:yes gene_type:complete